MKEFEFRNTYTLKEMEEMTDGMAHIEMPDESMKPRIRKGDFVIYDSYLKEIYREPTPMVVKLNGMTLVREAIQDGDGVITLRACSRKISPITVADDDDLAILGRVFGAMRQKQNRGRLESTLIPYPQPKNTIEEDPMGEGTSGADAFDTIPHINDVTSDEPLTDEAKMLISINPALYTVAKFIRDAPEGAIGRFTMPDDSMASFLQPGDVLLCDKRRQTPDPKHALLFVVKINGETTVREVWRDKKGSIRIRPHSQRFPCYIIEDGDDFEIVGKLFAVTELSMRHNDEGEEINNINMKLLPSPRRLSISEP